MIVKKALLKKVENKLAPLERSSFLSKATILDPRFKRIHFTLPVVVSNAISKISTEIQAEHWRRGQRSPDKNPDQAASEQDSGSSIQIDEPVQT